MPFKLNFSGFKRVRKEVALPSVGDARVYAIGDIHGRIDLLDELLAMIARDDAARPPMTRYLILMGDLVDRGPDSATVVRRAINLSQSASNVRFLKGNHEEVFVLAARGDVQAARFFRRIGGIETLASYGLDESESSAMDDDALASWMLTHIPRADVDFLDGFQTMIEIGDYLFVHAGIDPKKPISRQETGDLLWIRQPFLDHTARHERMVVHGHSITQMPDVRENRIGIDTGAYASGRLTALALEHNRRWFLHTGL
ncbi:metallophosphoesterase [Sphingobium sp. AN558]|uniref:metallophosphoesterase n=1 Tax=Sphingobium sp. AN558 TaxID=3133442 RepID=UPI0030BDE54E